MLRRALFSAVLLVAAVGTTGVAAAATGEGGTYVVLHERGVSKDAAHRAIARAGGTIVSENTAVGLATVRARSDRFAARARRQRALVGAAANEPIGYAPPGVRPKPDPVEAFGNGGSELPSASPAREPGPLDEPLAPLQWNMQMVNATSTGSHARQRGTDGVRVAILDSGIDASHPDLAANFNRAVSRNFTTDIPLVDGPCEDDPDGSCEDPADVDEYGHGSHVAGIVGAALNGQGVGGVAPEVSLVSLRVMQESGFVFLQPVVDALTYAANKGIDVANMSFFIDPWWMNCRSNPADSPQERAEQGVVIAATQAAINYARARGVTTIVSMGNAHIDLGNPTVDDISPGFPPGSERHREVDNSCRVMPVEAGGAIGVSALGPTGRKAHYSSYGVERTDLSGPGGDDRDRFGTPEYLSVENMVLSAFPEAVGREAGLIDPEGNPASPRIVRDGDGYYFWAQGTSMAAPHATGVAALIVAEQGRRDSARGGLTMDPRDVEASLRRGASDTPCPSPRTFVYPDPDLGPEFTATCEGPPRLNGFYGDGIVNALGFGA